MRPDRLTAFTDGVIAIIITIMVLELPTSRRASILASLKPVLAAARRLPAVLRQHRHLLDNHHHMLQAAERVDGRVLWANLVLLFWLSLVPFVIRWIDEPGITRWPVAAYGVVLCVRRSLICCSSER